MRNYPQPMLGVNIHPKAYPVWTINANEEHDVPVNNRRTSDINIPLLYQDSPEIYRFGGEGRVGVGWGRVAYQNKDQLQYSTQMAQWTVLWKVIWCHNISCLVTSLQNCLTSSHFAGDFREIFHGKGEILRYHSNTNEEKVYWQWKSIN